MCFDPTIGYYNHWQGQNHQANLQIVKFQTFGIGFSDSLPPSFRIKQNHKGPFYTKRQSYQGTFLLKDRLIWGRFVLKDRLIRDCFMLKDRVIWGRFVLKDRAIRGIPEQNGRHLEGFWLEYSPPLPKSFDGRNTFHSKSFDGRNNFPSKSFDRRNIFATFAYKSI